MLNAMGDRRRIRHLLAATVIAIILIATGLVTVGDNVADRLVDPAPAMPTRAAPASLTADERAFYDFVSSRLTEISAESDRLVHLAEGRSRNILELQTRGDRIDRGAEEIDAFARENGVPARFEGAFSLYRHGMSAIRSGRDEARSGFLSFDWDRVASAVDLFSTGADDLSHALDALETASGSAPSNMTTPEQHA